MSGGRSTYTPKTVIERWLDARLPLPRLVYDSLIVYPVPRNLNYAYIRSAVYRPWYRLFFWLFVANAILLGWLGPRSAEGAHVILSQLAMLYCFAFFIVIMPLLGLIEIPWRLPNSITEAVLEKSTAGGSPGREI